MQAPDATQRFATLDQKEGLEDYNLAHFRTKYLLQDFKRTLADRGILPGQPAPDFALPRVGGGQLRLSDLRGGPILLHFGSTT